MANSFNVGRSSQSLGQQQVRPYLLAANQTIRAGDPCVMTNASGENRIRKLTLADVAANFTVSAAVAGIWGVAISDAITDANGFSGLSNIPPGVSASAYPIFPLPNYADSIDTDPVTGVSRIGLVDLTQTFDVRAATSGTLTGTLTATGGTGGNGLLTVTALGAGITVSLGALVTGTGIPTGTYVASFNTGTGGIGTYTLSVPVTTEGSETITIYTVPLTINIGNYQEQSTGIQAVSDSGSGLIDFSCNFAATGAAIIAYVSGFLEQDPYYNTLSNQCRVELKFLPTYNQQTTGVIYTN